MVSSAHRGHRNSSYVPLAFFASNDVEFSICTVCVLVSVRVSRGAETLLLSSTETPDDCNAPPVPSNRATALSVDVTGRPSIFDLAIPADGLTSASTIVPSAIFADVTDPFGSPPATTTSASSSVRTTSTASPTAGRPTAHSGPVRPDSHDETTHTPSGVTSITVAARIIRCLSVPVLRLEVRPRAHRRLVPALDVRQPPLDLRLRVRPPVLTGTGHLRAGQRLRDAIRTRRRVLGLVVPAGLPGPQLLQRPPLHVAPLVLLCHVLPREPLRVGRGGLPLRRRRLRLRAGRGLVGLWTLARTRHLHHRRPVVRGLHRLHQPQPVVGAQPGQLHPVPRPQFPALLPAQHQIAHPRVLGVVVGARNRHIQRVGGRVPLPRHRPR